MGTTWLFSVDPGRSRLVVVNALAVANPDYRVPFETLEPEVVETNMTGVSISVALEQRSPWPEGASFRAMWDYRLKFGYLGSVTMPPLRPWRMTGALEALAVDNTDPGDLDLVESQLKGIGPRTVVSAVVKLREPMTEEAAARYWPDGFDVVLLSPGEHGGKPISWDSSSCAVRGFDSCGFGAPGTLVPKFRQWVSLLKPGDQSVLRRFGLDLGELRSRAREGVLYGFVVSGFPEELRKRLIHQPDLKAIEIVDAIPSN
ncbi:hypothetical protein ACWEN6_29455 [Sphaerisporangium sp. NPDC004334]